METPLFQYDAQRISEAVKSVTGYGIDEIRLNTRRTCYRKMPARVAICHYLLRCKYHQSLIAGAIGGGRTGVNYLMHCHDDIMFADRLYRRYIAELDNLLNIQRDEKID